MSYEITAAAANNPKLTATSSAGVPAETGLVDVFRPAVSTLAKQQIVGGGSVVSDDVTITGMGDHAGKLAGVILIA